MEIPKKYANTPNLWRLTNEELKAALISAIMELTEAEAAELLQQWKEARA